jgi:thiol-disulfide isomerase/thioredoxin
MSGRRSWLVAGVGVVAAGAGLGWALRRHTTGDAPGVAEALWSLRFPQPGGGELALADFRGRPLLINFWATWCPPCVRELPLLDRFARAQPANGWQVVGLAVDGPTPVREFLQRSPLGFPIGLAGLDGTTLSRQLGNTQGALPFSVAFDARGRLRERQLGEVDDALLKRWTSSI